jgi:hypothetical protein
MDVVIPEEWQGMDWLLLEQCRNCPRNCVHLMSMSFLLRFVRQLVVHFNSHQFSLSHEDGLPSVRRCLFGDPLVAHTTDDILALRNIT